VETHVLQGTNIARSLVDFAIRHGVTRLFMGRSRKRGWREFFRRSVIEQVIRLSPWIDINVVADR
jgi:two-component system sensor histidine kinase KdpD